MKYKHFKQALLFKVGSEINGGKVSRFPFSIGKVCFQNLCMFDKEWTYRIIEEIKDRSYAERAGRLGKLTRIFSK